MALATREDAARYGLAYPAATVIAVAGLGAALGLPVSRALFFLTVGAALVGVLGASGRRGGGADGDAGDGGDASATGGPGRKLLLYGAGTFVLAWLGVLLAG